MSREFSTPGARATNPQCHRGHVNTDKLSRTSSAPPPGGERGATDRTSAGGSAGGAWCALLGSARDCPGQWRRRRAPLPRRPPAGRSRLVFAPAIGNELGGSLPASAEPPGQLCPVAGRHRIAFKISGAPRIGHKTISPHRRRWTPAYGSRGKDTARRKGLVGNLAVTSPAAKAGPNLLGNTGYMKSTRRAACVTSIRQSVQRYRT